MRRLAVHTAIAMATLAGLYFCWQVHETLFLFLLSLGVAASLRPLVQILSRRGFPRWLSLATAYLIAIGAPGLLLLVAGEPILSQIKAVGDDAVRAYQHIEDGWKEGASWQQAVAEHVPRPQQIYEALLGKTSLNLFSTILGATFGVFGGVVDFVLMIFLSVYWSIDQVHFERLWLSLLPVRERMQARELWRAIETEAGAYLRSEAIQTVTASCVLWLGYTALGQPYPTLLALLCGLVWLVPWVGALIAVVVLGLLSLPTLVLDGGASFPTVTLPAALYTFAVLLIVERVIEPRLFNRRRYNALLTALVTIGMAQIWGLFGLLLGPPVSAIIQIVAWQWMNRQAHPSIETPIDRAAFGERFQAIRESVARAAEPQPELLSLVARLEKLVQETERLAP